MDKSGIYSQRGFAFQAEVFLHFAAKMNPGSLIKYEYLDDIAIDSQFDGIGQVEVSTGALLQVKATAAKSSDVINIYTNWILAYCEKHHFKEFRLILSSGYSCHKSFRDLTGQSFLGEIKKAANLHPKSLARKLDDALSDDEILDYFNFVKEHSQCQEIEDTKSKYFESLKTALHYRSCNDETYQNRIEEVRGRIKNEISDCMLNNEYYELSFEQLMTICEDVCQCMRDGNYLPSYSAWIAENPFDSLKGMETAREVEQLRTCFDGAEDIIKHIGYKEYYASLRYRRFEDCQRGLVAELEEVTYFNFDNVREKLIETGMDTPARRLRKTKAESNCYCSNDHEKWGSCIYLTRENTPSEILISWREVQNE